MDLPKLLQSLETLIFDALLWLLLFPKTLLRTIARPVWAIAYIEEQLALEEKARFDEYMSPVSFFAACVLLPFAVFLDRQTSIGIGSILPTAVSTLQNQFLLTVWNSITIALGFALASRGDTKPLVTRIGLRKHFLTQCYITGPMILVLNASLPSSLIERLTSTPTLLQSALEYAGLLAMVWFAWAEAAVLSSVAHVSRMRGLLLVAAGMGFWGILNLLWVAPMIAYALASR